LNRIEDSAVKYFIKDENTTSYQWAKDLNTFVVRHRIYNVNTLGSGVLVHYDTVRYRCRRCDKNIDNENRHDSQWDSKKDDYTYICEICRNPPRITDIGDMIGEYVKGQH